MTQEEIKEQLAKAVKEKLIAQARLGYILPFTKYTFNKYEINWHHELLAKYIDDFIAKKIRRLMIFMPPRHGKSELTSRRLPALLHGLYPNDEVLLASYNSELASAMTIDVQRIMDRPEYQQIFPTVRLTAEGSKSGYARNSNEHEVRPWQDPVSRLWEWHTGSLKSAGIGGSFTGRGGNWVLIDDPVKNREDADSASFREKLYDFYSSTLRTRLEGTGSVLITMTRWHDDDLAGRLIKLAQNNKVADQWTVLDLPAIKMRDDNPEDVRNIGQPLWETKFNEADMAATKESVGSRDWSALYQQSPVAEGGNIFKQEWFRFWKILPERFDTMIHSWDMATKDKATSDYYVGQVWGKKGADKYLIFQYRARADLPTVNRQLLKMCEAFPKAYTKYIEAKANGPAVVQTLRKVVTGLVEVEPRGDKVARANAVTPQFESGNVYIPHPDICPWVGDYMNELLAFPYGVNDDQVDATTQALDKLREKGILSMPVAGHGE